MENCSLWCNHQFSCIFSISNQLRRQACVAMALIKNKYIHVFLIFIELGRCKHQWNRFAGRARTACWFLVEEDEDHEAWASNQFI